MQILQKRRGGGHNCKSFYEEQKCHLISTKWTKQKDNDERLSGRRFAQSLKIERASAFIKAFLSKHRINQSV